MSPSNKSKKILVISISIALLILLLLLIVPPLIFIVGTSYNNLNTKNFDDFKVEEITKNNRNYLLISGQCDIETCGSSLKVRKISQQEENGNIYVNVGITIFSDSSSAFVYPVELSRSVNKVMFGNEKTVIWER